MTRAYVAVDQGGHATRATAYNLAGQRLGFALVTVATQHNALGHVEHDGDELAASIAIALEELAGHVPVQQWDSIGLAVQRSTIACWDSETGALLAPVISWQDRRNALWLKGLTRHADRVHELTGLPLSPHYGASKLRWCLDHLPAVRQAAAEGRLQAGPLASFLMHRILEGRPFVCDAVNASRTLLWSPFQRCWSKPMLELFGIPPAILPPVTSNIMDFGVVSLQGSQVPLRLCTGDQSVVPYASGLLDPAAAYVNLGTGAFTLLPLKSPLPALPLLTSLIHDDGQHARFALEGTVNGAGAALTWLEHHQGADAARLLALLAREPLVDDEAPLFLNGVSGLGSPFWRPDFVTQFVGEGTPLQECRAVLESVAFLIKANLDEMRLHAAAPQRLVASGGLAANALLCRLLATLSGVAVDYAEDREATSRGLAFLLAGQPSGFIAQLMTRTPPEADAALLARYLAWLEHMRSSPGG